MLTQTQARYLECVSQCAYICFVDDPFYEREIVESPVGQTAALFTTYNGEYFIVPIPNFN